MSDESQAERIWRYAMQPANPTLDAPGTLAELAPDTKLDDSSNASTDLSGSFRTMLSRIQFHGLAESQPPTLDMPDRPPKERAVNEELSNNPVPTSNGDPALSGPKPHSSSSPTISKPIIPGPERQTARNVVAPTSPPLKNGHVTPHVTDAPPPRGANPIVGHVTDVDTAAVPTTNQEGQRKENGHSKPFFKGNKASSFHVRPEISSSPHPLKRISTMPPRLNRYAPRDVQPSSQDSFAGSPPRQDLNAYIRNSEVFNNLYIRPGVDGRPSEIFELPSGPSAGPSAMPRPKRQKATARSVEPAKKEDDEEEEKETPSQLIRAALEHGLIQRSPPPSAAPLPVVLVKDSQSDHGRNNSEDDLSTSRNVSDDDMEDVQSESQAIDHSPAPTSSSFVLPKALALGEDEPTQSTQPASEDIPPGMIIVTPYDMRNSMTVSGFSSLPIPEHRRFELAALQRYRNSNEVVPATPMSTVPPSGPVSIPANVESTTQRLSDLEGKEKERDAEAIRQRNKPSSKTEGLRRSERVKSAPSSKDDRRPQAVVAGNEIVPDSQEEQTSNTSLKVPPPHIKPNQHTTHEVVPDSQEEEQKPQQPRDPFSSPSIPLAQQVNVPSVRSISSSPSIPLIQTTNRQDSNRFPTPTPAAVKSPLRKGQLPEGVTHARGRGRSNSKGKAPMRPEPEEGEKPNVDEHDYEHSDGANDAMALKEEGGEGEGGEEQKAEPDPEPSRRKPSNARKRGSGSKLATREKRTTRQRPQRTTAAGKVVSRKRKSDPKLEHQPSEVSLPPPKRHRSHMTTPGPSAAIELDKRVIARRQDDGNYYHVGTVHLEYVPSDPTPACAFVEFDDGHQEMVDLDDMRSFHMEPGDLIEVAEYKKSGPQYRRATVLDTDHWEDEVMQVHDLEGGPDGDDYDVNGGDIRVSEEQIRLQWNERYVNLRTLCKDKEFELPRRNKHLSGYAFIVTLPDLPKSKRSIQRIIELSGGVVCEWNSIVSLSGTPEVDGNRVVGKSSDVHLVKNRTRLKGLFCVADEPRTTPKFLIALALGVPCLSVDWVRTQAGVGDTEVKFDWQAYILPTGVNPVTKMAASQNFDRTWWRNIDNYPQLLSDPPIWKPFTGKSFLCVGPSFIPKLKEFGTYPKVLLAMGASTVLAVTELKYLNAKSQIKFDYTVVDDDAEPFSHNGSLGINISWIKKCLITGIEGPVPWPE